jgi:hypothetical protein
MLVASRNQVDDAVASLFQEWLSELANSIALNELWFASRPTAIHAELRKLDYLRVLLYCDPQLLAMP